MIFLALAMAWDAPPPFTKVAQVKVETALKDELLDGESARWRWLPAKSDGSEVVQYCGFVNAKNRMGGYIGFRPIWASGGWKDGRFVPAASFIGDDDFSTFMAKRMCGTAGYDMSAVPPG